MCDEKKYTYRDIVMAKRDGYVTGLHHACWRDPATKEDALSNAADSAKCQYPLQVERPRVVKDPHAECYEWRIGPIGNAQWRDAGESPEDIGGRFHDVGDDDECCVMSPQRIRMLADLLANPTELVDAE